MLVENTLFGTIDKVADSIARIKAFEPPEGYYVAFSGGKDSVVVLDLVKRAGVKFDAHYNLTTVDPPELVKFIRREHPEVEIHRPKKSMWQLIVEKQIPPTRLARYCCAYLKENGGEGRRVITGVRWAESVKRSKRKMLEHCMRGKSLIYLHPIIDWTHEDVWEFIKTRGIQYCSLYDEGYKRLGCVGCPMAGKEGMRKEFIRWPKLKASYMRAFGRMIEARIESGKTAPGGNWDTAEGVMDWWINGSDKGDPDQTVLFE